MTRAPARLSHSGSTSPSLTPGLSVSISRRVVVCGCVVVWCCVVLCVCPSYMTGSAALTAPGLSGGIRRFAYQPEEDLPNSSSFKCRVFAGGGD